MEKAYICNILKTYQSNTCSLILSHIDGSCVIQKEKKNFTKRTKRHRKENYDVGSEEMRLPPILFSAFFFLCAIFLSNHRLYMYHKEGKDILAREKIPSITPQS